MRSEFVKALAVECGFELAGVAPAESLDDFARYQEWLAQGMAGEMSYLAGRRGELRAHPRSLLPAARSIICVGKLYDAEGDPGGIARFAHGEDYHRVMRRGLERLRVRLAEATGAPFEARVCVDTAPLLERSYAHCAGLGWIGRNACLIRAGLGSWFVLGELLVSLELEPDSPVPDRCGACTLCIEACPTRALVPAEHGCFLDARRCISYWTIERRGAVPDELQPLMRGWTYGCDICQEVCPWNQCSPLTGDPAFATGR